MPFRVLQVSDTHLSGRRAYFVANFDAVAAAAAASAPDLVIGSGDLALDDPDDEDDAGFARARWDRIEAPWRALPGNHDIGDTEPDPWMGQVVSAARRARWLTRWGPDWWTVEAGRWVVIGLDSLLFGSDLPAEAEQWEWLSGVTADAGRRPVMLVVHKPLCLWDLHEEAVTQTAVTPDGRRRLWDALGGARLRLVASGHAHQYRAWTIDGVVMVWAPSTAFVSKPAEPSAYGAAKVVGAVEYRFDARAVGWQLVQPPGLVAHDVAVVAGGAETLRDAPERPVDT